MKPIHNIHNLSNGDLLLFVNAGHFVERNIAIAARRTGCTHFPQTLRLRTLTGSDIWFCWVMAPFSTAVTSSHSHSLSQVALCASTLSRPITSETVAAYRVDFWQDKLVDSVRNHTKCRV